MESYHENNNPGPPIEMSFDFDKDLRDRMPPFRITPRPGCVWS